MTRRSGYYGRKLHTKGTFYYRGHKFKIRGRGDKVTKGEVQACANLKRAIRRVERK